jgi:hypothetical protein
MQDAIGIGLLLGTALLFRLCLHSTVLLGFHRHDVVRAIPFNIISFWILLLIAGMWALTAGFVFIARSH